MSTLEAQRHAAAIVREMREQVGTLQPQLQKIGQLNRGLEALMPELSPAAADAIRAEVATIADVVGAAFTDSLNPAHDPA